MKEISKVFVLLFAGITAIVGYHVNVHDGSFCPLFWSIVDFLFAPISWVKWLICEQVNISIIKESFAFFLQ